MSPCSTEPAVSSSEDVRLFSGRSGASSGSGGRNRHRNRVTPRNVSPAEPMKRSSHPWIVNSALLRSGAITFPADIAAIQ